MAEKEKKEETKEAKPSGGGNKLMLVVVILLVLVLLAVVGLGAYVFMSNSHKPADAAHAEETVKEEKKKKKEGPPVFEKLEPFVVNLAGGSAMLQIELQAEVADAEAQAQLKAYLPKIRSAMILLLSSKTEEELQSADGKIKLKAQVKKIMNEAMDAAETEPVENVLFTSFIIQLQ